MKYLVMGLLLLVGIINFFPVIGVLSADRLVGLYAVELDSPDLVILMRHRAVLFGLLGAFIILSAFRPALRLLACIGGLMSMLAFVALAYAAGEYGEALHKIVVADIIGSIGLGIVLILDRRAKTPA